MLARFKLGGGSPYAPGIVFVIEWVKREFLKAVGQACVGFLEETSGSRKGVGKAFLYEVFKEGFGQYYLRGKRRRGFGYQELVRSFRCVRDDFLTTGRKSVLVRRKLKECGLAIHAITSRDEAINLTKRLVFIAANR